MVFFNYDEKQRYIIPTSDWGFKRLFGTEMNKGILIGLLNRLLPEEHILDVTYLNTELLIPIGKRTNEVNGFTVRKGVVDVYCRCQDDRRIIVEMQNHAYPSFVDRAVVYAAASILENYTINLSSDYEVKKTYFIAITGTSVFSDLGHVPVRIGLCDLDSPTVVQLSEKVLLMFVELPKFAECEEQLGMDSSFLDQFSVAMKTMGCVSAKPEMIRDELLDRIYVAADTHGYAQEDKEKYRMSIMTEIEFQATLRDFFKDGMEKGIEEGKAIGVKKTQIETARMMKKEGYPLDAIVRITHLSEEEISSL